MTRWGPWAAAALMAACGSDGTSGGGGGRDGGRVDAGPPPGPSEGCAPFLARVPLPDFSSPDHVIGDGTPASCTEAALREAVESGGTITFDCGPAEHVIAIGEPLRLVLGGPDVSVDGGGRVVLDGGGDGRLFEVDSSFERGEPTLTVQGLTLRNGRARTSDGDDGPTRGGGALWSLGGTIVAIDAVFDGNETPVDGPDIAGGAIYNVGEGDTYVVRSVFSNNRGASGGAIGNLLNDFFVLDSVLTGNAATGLGTGGGNGGAIYSDGVEQEAVICGSELRGNDARVLGGGIFRVSNTPTGTQLITRTLIADNVVEIRDLSGAGGAYLQGMEVTVVDSAFVRNTAPGSGGLFLGPGGTRVDFLNVMIANNEALGSLGGGLSVDPSVTGRLRFVTVAGNGARNPASFAGGMFGGGQLTLEAVVFADNAAGNEFNPITCTTPQQDGGGNVQWPVERASRGSDDPDALCAPGIRVVDPEIGPLADRSGPTGTYPVRVPGAPEAVAVSEGCPATDLLGAPRGDSCSAGAVEP
ncbi:MAG: hypothetical protein AAF447_02815 [Myxococcota bacterium]